jgi:3-hydroxybenzoate 6-monooxygenase
LGGLAAAYALAQDGHQVMVLEQSSGFGEIGAGIQLGPKQLPDVRCLGLTEAINKAAYFPPGLRMNGVRSGEKVVWIP